jgi:hypothetical protein
MDNPRVNQLLNAVDYLIHKTPITVEQKAFMDVNKDGKITIEDIFSLTMFFFNRPEPLTAAQKNIINKALFRLARGTNMTNSQRVQLNTFIKRSFI